MRRLETIILMANQYQALMCLREKLIPYFNVINIVIYGSFARGEADNESDIDLLIITKEPFSRQERHKITDLVFDINLEFDTNFSTLVVDQNSWERGAFSVLPIHDEILREGIAV